MAVRKAKGPYKVYVDGVQVEKVVDFTITQDIDRESFAAFSDSWVTSIPVLKSSEVEVTTKRGRITGTPEFNYHDTKTNTLYIFGIWKEYADVEAWQEAYARYLGYTTGSKYFWDMLDKTEAPLFEKAFKAGASSRDKEVLALQSEVEDIRNKKYLDDLDDYLDEE